MKILLLTLVLPYPPDSGPKVKTYSLLRYLAQSHEITLVSFTRGDQSADVEALRQFCHAVYTTPMRRSLLGDAGALAVSLATRRPWIIARDADRAMEALVEELCRREHFDAVHCDQLNMAQFAPDLPGLIRVLDAHNALWQLYQRLASTSQSLFFRLLYRRDWPLLKAYEGQVCRDFDSVLAVSETDGQALSEAAGRPLAVVVAPITVDSRQETYIERNPGSRRLVQVGTMFWQPNIEGVQWFIQEVFPLIRQRYPEVQFDVVGARPPESLTRYNQPGTGIHVTGYVDDLTPYLENTGVYVVPLLAGSGMRVKILEALSHGMPVVTTPIGCEGIEVRDREHLYIADTPQEFADSVCGLLEDPQEARRIGLNGRALIEERYDYHVALHALDRLYRPHAERVESQP